MKLRGQFVDMMCEVNEEYKEYSKNKGSLISKTLNSERRLTLYCNLQQKNHVRMTLFLVKKVKSNS